MTAWGKKALTALLEQAAFELPEGRGSVEVVRLRDLQGDASIAVVRQKKKHFFDWSFTVDWRVVDRKEQQQQQKDGVGCDDDDGSSSIACRGSLLYPDVSPDGASDGYEAPLSGVPRFSLTAKSRKVVDDFVRSPSVGLQKAIAAQIEKFTEQFNAVE